MSLQTPTATTAPVAGTSPGLWTFTEGQKESIALDNNDSSRDIFLLFNAGNNASANLFDLRLRADTFFKGQTHELGHDAVNEVSVFFPSGYTITDFNIRGG